MTRSLIVCTNADCNKVSRSAVSSTACTIAGVYVPTDIPVVSQWPRCKPWLMTSPSQFRPGPPPDLSSEAWAKDYDEIKELGGKNSMRRAAEQTAMALFWQATRPPSTKGSYTRSPTYLDAR